MRTKAIFRRNVALKNFSAARRGNVAIAFALASVFVIGMVGFAVDYSRANSVKANLQATLDSTALMLSKKAATDCNQRRTDASS